MAIYSREVSSFAIVTYSMSNYNTVETNNDIFIRIFLNAHLTIYRSLVRRYKLVVVILIMLFFFVCAHGNV